MRNVTLFQLRGKNGLSFLLLGFLSLFAAESFGQDTIKKDDADTLVNAYSLSHDLYQLKRKIDFSKTADPKLRKDAETVLSELYYYFNVDNADDLFSIVNKDSSLENLLFKVQRAGYYFPIDKQIACIKELWEKKDYPSKAKYDSLFTKVNNLNQIKINFETAKSRAAKCKDTAYYCLENDNKFQFSLIIKTPLDKDTFRLSISEYDHLKPQADSIKQLIELKFINIFDSLLRIDDPIIKPFIKKNIDNLTVFSSDIEISNKQFKKSLSHIQETNYEINMLDQQSSGSTAGWKMPSESEMIDAVATYIASRVKQETVLWFFEEMRVNTERYELLNTAFPQTLKLLKTGEIFEAPNMGSAWKYALAEDFVKLPENILNSEWLDDRIPKDHRDEIQLLKVAADISHMVNNRLSYDDIIKQLYMKNCLNDTVNKPPVLRSSINFLYAISTELSVLTKKKDIRKITFEELQAMPLDQMRILLQLLNIKYSGCITKQYAGILDNPKLTLPQKQEISVWIGNSLQALEQFDNILRQVREGIANDGDKQITIFDGYNTWKLIGDAMFSAFPESQKKNYNYSLDRMEDIFEVYHLMTEKNYAGAVVKTLQLVDSLLYTNKLGVLMNNYKIDCAFKIPVVIASDNNVFYMNLTELDKLFMERRINPKKFPRVAKKIKLNSIMIKDTTLFTLNKSGTQWYLNIKPSELKKILLRANPDRIKKYEEKVNRLFRKINNSELDRIIRNYPKWGGTYKSDSVFFAINSIVAQALISQDKKEMQMIQKLASFLNDVALADDAKELKKVVESYALPVGSYKQKRSSWQSLSLNAFAGVYGGYETNTFMAKRIKNEHFESGFNYGISAPIGLTYSKTFAKRTYANSRLSQNYRYNQDLIKIGRKNLKVKSNWNMSFTFSIVDLGAVVSYRTSNTDSVLNQSFKWEQFISPGLHIGLAIPRTPLVFQLGYQYTPRIRKISVDHGTAEREYSMWRVYAGIYFDIPMFNLWVKTRSVHFE